MTQTECWQVTGSASEIDEQHLVPAVFQPWATLLIEQGQLQPGERILDVACGTGIVARFAAQRVGAAGRVTGLDLNPGMLEVARSVSAHLASFLTWQEGSATALPFGAAEFDVVFCQLGLQFFPDRSTALREMVRVLVPGGRLFLLVWRAIEHSLGFAALASALERHVGPEAASLMYAPFVFGDTTAELHMLCEQAGLQEVRVRFETRMVRFPSGPAMVRSYVAGSPLAGQMARAAETAGKRLIQDVAAALQHYIDDEGLAFPIEGQIIRGKK